MKYTSIIILFITVLFFTGNVYSQSGEDLGKEVECPCMLEYEFNADVKETLNTGMDFYPVLKFTKAEIKDDFMICNYEKVFSKLTNATDFDFIKFDELSDKWESADNAVVKYYNSQNFKASISNYIYGNLSSVMFDDSFQSFELADSSSSNIVLKSGGKITLNVAKTGFIITRNDVIKMIELAPVSSVPKTLGKKKNSIIKSKK